MYIIRKGNLTLEFLSSLPLSPKEDGHEGTPAPDAPGESKLAMEEKFNTEKFLSFFYTVSRA